MLILRIRSREGAKEAVKTIKPSAHAARYIETLLLFCLRAIVCWCAVAFCFVFADVRYVCFFRSGNLVQVDLVLEVRGTRYQVPSSLPNLTRIMFRTK